MRQGVLNNQRLLLVEFNELCPSLLERFINEGQLPNFQRFFESSLVYTTDAGEESPNLEPWIQWPTVHSGLTYAEHGVFHLGDGKNLEHKCIAELISDAGMPVGIFGSMNVNYRRLNGYLVPDPWSKDGVAQPESLQPFYRIVAAQVQESSRENGWSKREAAAFAWSMLRHGLSMGTARSLAAQVWQDRSESGLKWRRAALLDQVQYDVFRTLNRRYAVRFATLFCNSTAHFQHYFWRNMEPDHFEVPPPESDHPSLRQAILFGYQNMDRVIGRLLRDYPRDVLVLCSAMSQQPWSETTKCTFRPRNFLKFLEFAGVFAEHTDIKPVMAEQFHLQCKEGSTDSAEKSLRGLVVGTDQLLHVRREGQNLFVGCRLNDPNLLHQSVTRAADGQSCRFDELFYMIHGMRSGHHHPDGVFWVRNGQHRVFEQRVPLTTVAPTILSYFGLTAPEYMRSAPLPIFGTPDQAIAGAI